MKWTFKQRFRRHAFGWQSQPAIRRIKEAVSEIKRVARGDALLAAEGAVSFLERLSPALEHVDSSSGAIGTAVNNAIDAVVPIIAKAPASPKVRDAWLERLYEAYEDDEIPYIERLGDHWGELCASKEVASAWADRLIEISRMAWSPDPNLRGFFKGTINCLSALLAAERHEELLELLDLERHGMWHYRQYGVRALAAMGRRADAIRYAESSGGRNDRPVAVARACEELLLSSGMADEAYRRYGLLANRASTYLAWFRAVAGSTLTRRPRRSSEIWSPKPRARKASGSRLPSPPGSSKRPLRSPIAPPARRRRSRERHATMRRRIPISRSGRAWPLCAGWPPGTATRSLAPMCSTRSRTQ